MSDCLGDVAAALVDCELSHDARDRALSHIAGCDPCRKEVDAQRRLKALLANQSDPEVCAGLTARLMDVPRVAARPSHPDVVRPRRRRPRRSLKARAATYSALGVALVGGVVAAGGEQDGRKVRPPVTTFVQEHSATTGEMGPLHDPAGTILVATYP